LILHSIECRDTEPKTYEEAMCSLRHKWEEAITSELDPLDENKTKKYVNYHYLQIKIF
jgi:hypothetical protein